MVSNYANPITYDDFMNHPYFTNQKNIDRMVEEYKQHKIQRDGVYSYSGYPSVTSVLGMMDPQKDMILGRWRKSLVNKGLDPEKITDNYAKVGTVIHYSILSRVSPVEIEPPMWKICEYPDRCDELTGNGLKQWKLLVEGDEPQLTIESPLCEQYFKHDKEKFCGIYDLYAIINGKKTLADLKTSPKCRDSYFMQLGAYSMFFDTMPEQGMIINVCPDERNLSYVKTKQMRPVVSSINQTKMFEYKKQWCDMIRAWHSLFDEYLPIVESANRMSPPIRSVNQIEK